MGPIATWLLENAVREAAEAERLKSTGYAINIEMGITPTYDVDGNIIGSNPNGTCSARHTLFPNIVGYGKSPDAGMKAMTELVMKLAESFDRMRTEMSEMQGKK